MKKIILLLALNLLISCKQNQRSNEDSQKILNAEKWEPFFGETGLNGTFGLKKLRSDTLEIYNVERAQKQFLPASTFKILNSLISLEVKVINDENEIIKWDGKARFYDKWNQDHNLKSAIKYSCVWFYQELARRVGKEKMQYYLDTTRYGNSKIGTDVDKFWLEGDLRISALEQMKFLEEFLNKELPFSKENFGIVKNIMLIDSTSNYKLYAKTGWTARVGNQIGWYVGFIIQHNNTWIFAMNIDINDNKDAKLRQEITRKILILEGLIK